MYLILSIINYILLIAVLVSAIGIFYFTIKEKPVKRWIRILVFATIVSLACMLIDKNFASFVAFIGFYSFIFAILSFILTIYFTSKKKLEFKKIWITVFIIFLVLFIASFAITGVFFR